MKISKAANVIFQQENSKEFEHTHQTQGSRSCLYEDVEWRDSGEVNNILTNETTRPSSQYLYILGLLTFCLILATTSFLPFSFSTLSCSYSFISTMPRFFLIPGALLNSTQMILPISISTKLHLRHALYFPQANTILL